MDRNNNVIGDDEEQNMTVIDIDSHFEPVADWLDAFPSLKAELPERFPTDDPRFVMRPPRSSRIS